VHILKSPKFFKALTVTTTILKQSSLQKINILKNSTFPRITIMVVFSLENRLASDLLGGYRNREKEKKIPET